MRYSKKSTGRITRRIAAFTLLEILVVLAIMGMLVGLLVTNVDKIFGDAQASTTKLAVNQTFKTALTTYFIQMGSYPTTAEGLQALVTAPASKSERWRGPYFSDAKLPKDGWDEPFQYAFPGTHNKDGYDLWSKGKDKQSGTTDDIGNWDVAPPTP